MTEIGSITGARMVLDKFDRATAREAHNLSRRPYLVWQQLYNELQWDDLVHGYLAPQFARRTVPGSRVWLRLRTPVGRSGELSQVLRGHEGIVWTCAVTPDGSSVVSSDEFGTILIWDSRTGRTRLTLEGHQGAVNGCVVGPGGAYLVSAGEDGTLRTWDATTGVELERVANEERPILCCAVALDGSCIVSGSADGSVTIWERREVWEPRRLEGHTNIVTACAIAPDGRFIVSGQREREDRWMWERTPLRVWDRDGRLVHVLKGHRGSIADCAISPDGLRVVSAGEDSKLMLWDLRSGRRRRVIKWVKRGEARWWKKVRQKVMSCAFAPDGSLFLAGSGYGELGLWDSSGKEVRILSGHTNAVQACAVSPDRAFVVSASWDETLMMWSLEPREEKATAGSAHTDSVMACAVAPDGSFLVSASHDRTLKVREPERAHPRITIQPRGKIDFCAVSPDSSYIVSGGGGFLGMWDVQQGREIDSPTKREPVGGLLGCAVSPDGSFVASLHHDRQATEKAYKLRLWDAVSGDSLPLPPEPEVPAPSFFQEPQRTFADFVMLYGCTVGPDGPRLVLKTFHGAIVVMDIASGRRVVIPEADADREVLTLGDMEAVDRAQKRVGDVNGCAIGPDGSFVVTASGNQQLKIWDTRTGQEVRAFGSRSNGACAVSPDGLLVASGHGDNLVLWQARTGRLAAAIPVVGSVWALAFHPSRPKIYCGTASGDVLAIDLEGIRYGPLFVTGIDDGSGPTLRCPACGQTHLVNESDLDRVIVCRTLSCGQELSVNTFVSKPPRVVTGWRAG